MIVALEGSDGTWKSTCAELLRTRLNLPVYADRVRHGLLGDLDAEGMFLTGNQCNLCLTALSRELHLVADRWALSSVVYDGLRGIGRERYEELLGIYARASAWVFLLDAPPSVARERVAKRDGKPRRTLSEMERIREAFLETAEWWRRLGGNLTVVPAVQWEETERRVLAGTELALLYAGRAG